jgi:Leucine-rich repeat (LRR) protein
MGGNQLAEVPSTLGRLKQLHALVLCDNIIESLPSNIANLHNLKSLLLHKNKLRTLPPEIVALKNLTEVPTTYLDSSAMTYDDIVSVKSPRQPVNCTFRQ